MSTSMFSFVLLAVLALSTVNADLTCRVGTTTLGFSSYTSQSCPGASYCQAYTYSVLGVSTVAYACGTSTCSAGAVSYGLYSATLSCCNTNNCVPSSSSGSLSAKYNFAIIAALSLFSLVAYKNL